MQISSLMLAMQAHIMHVSVCPPASDSVPTDQPLSTFGASAKVLHISICILQQLKQRSDVLMREARLCRCASSLEQTCRSKWAIPSSLILWTTTRWVSRLQQILGSSICHDIAVKGKSFAWTCSSRDGLSCTGGASAPKHQSCSLCLGAAFVAAARQAACNRGLINSRPMAAADSRSPGVHFACPCTTTRQFKSLLLPCPSANNGCIFEKSWRAALWWQVAPERKLRVRKDMKWGDLRQLAADQLSVPVGSQRFWTWAKRQNGTYRYLLLALVLWGSTFMCGTYRYLLLRLVLWGSHTHALLRQLWMRAPGDVHPLPRSCRPLEAALHV